MGSNSHIAGEINSLPAKLRSYARIKEAFDNLPNGVCYFDGSGVPILVNRVMHELVFALTKRDIQNLSELDGIMKEPSEVFPGNGTVWRFTKRSVGDSGGLTEIIAADITELYRRRRELENGNAEQRDIMRRIEEISENVVSITRNEEILAMKMRIHNELGYALSATRRFIASDCAEDKKDEYIAKQREMAKKLLGEIGNDDETDIFSELKQSAEKLGMEIVFEGEMPRYAEEIMTKAVRECLINTVRHALGDKVFVKACIEEEKYTAVITNNGKPPSAEITEGGGLASLRGSIEGKGGTMTVKSVPEFSMTVEIPAGKARK